MTHSAYRYPNPAHADRSNRIINMISAETTGIIFEASRRKLKLAQTNVQVLANSRSTPHAALHLSISRYLSTLLSHFARSWVEHGALHLSISRHLLDNAAQTYKNTMGAASRHLLGDPKMVTQGCSNTCKKQ